VLAFSPVGDAFRNRLRLFPSLVTCTTINWFTLWPQDALQSVAERSLAVRPSPLPHRRTQVREAYCKRKIYIHFRKLNARFIPMSNENNLIGFCVLYELGALSE
jgi:dynein heavy chain